MKVDLGRRLVAEAIGTAGLLVAIVGSGIMGEQLADGNVAIALLANSTATGLALTVLILTFVSVSGAHLNPVVTLSEVTLGTLSWREGVFYSLAQLGGAVLGVGLANLMFGLAVFSVSDRIRAGSPLFLSEILATFGLVLVILMCSRRHPSVLAFAVGAYIAAAYWFARSTSFANPAVTLGRSITDTFTGIRPIDVPLFVGAQIIGAVLATLLFRWLMEPESS